MTDDKSLTKTSMLERLRSSSLAGKAEGGSLTERARLYLKTTKGDQALLLDTSGSMSGSCGDGTRVSRIERLKQIVSDLPPCRVFSFASQCSETPPSFASGGTDMAKAFSTVKSAGVHHIVLITDGQPDSAERALSAANGLKIDIIYVGPPPEPEFLYKLAAATGGSYGQATLAQPKAIEERVVLLLESSI